GLTYGVNGLQTAYELLQYYYIGDGNNQIILATDGLFSSVNAPITENELNKEVRKQASNNNIRLSVIGFGQDEEGEKLMQKLASNGEGQFIQIKNPWEAKTVLIEEIKLNSRLQ
ncbi:MAG: VWA domain-containing protein, partial [Bacteroidetes bacterium]|nr:VWA domain-containing protein [Bacteroidota bacterium]